jgi:fatty-acyl-CoA synthase
MDEDGYFFLIDRARDMYITGGENVYPAEVERVLKELPEIEDIAIVGIRDETWGEVGHAFVIRKPVANLNAEDIINFCKERLAAFKCPRKITFCKAFPRTSLGKVLKRELIKEEIRT